MILSIKIDIAYIKYYRILNNLNTNSYDDYFHRKRSFYINY